MPQKIFFHPWVGKDYATGGIFGKKILVLGESHYCGESCEGCGTDKCAECHSFTVNVMNAHLDPNVPRENWMRTFVKFERSLVNHETDLEERTKIWDCLAFYNYLQVAVDDTREAGPIQQYRDAEQPFFQVLDNLKPDLLIVWGHRLWNLLPSKNWFEGSKILIDDYSVNNGYYHTDNGTVVKSVCVYHPSAGYSWDFWYKVIQSVFFSFVND